MNIPAPLQRLVDFLVSGKPTDTVKYQPDDMAVEMSDLETALAAGLSSKHMAAGSMDTTQIADKAVTLAKLADMATASLYYRKTANAGVPEVNSLATLKTDLGLTGTNSGDQTISLLPFSGVDGSGVDPVLACTLTGALIGASVAAVIDTSDFSDQRALFETSIAANDSINQVSLTDLSAKTYLALLVK